MITIIIYKINFNKLKMKKYLIYLLIKLRKNQIERVLEKQKYQIRNFLNVKCQVYLVFNLIR